MRCNFILSNPIAPFFSWLVLTFDFLCKHLRYKGLLGCKICKEIIHLFNSLVNTGNKKQYRIDFKEFIGVHDFPFQMREKRFLASKQNPKRLLVFLGGFSHQESVVIHSSILPFSHFSHFKKKKVIDEANSCAFCPLLGALFVSFE